MHKPVEPADDRLIEEFRNAAEPHPRDKYMRVRGGEVLALIALIDALRSELNDE